MVAPARAAGGDTAARGAFAFWGLRAKARPVPADTDPALPFEIAPRLLAFTFDEERSAWRDSVHRHVLSGRRGSWVRVGVRFRVRVEV